jgi:hypothetical protein
MRAFILCVTLKKTSTLNICKCLGIRIKQPLLLINSKFKKHETDTSYLNFSLCL